MINYKSTVNLVSYIFQQYQYVDLPYPCALILIFFWVVLKNNGLICLNSLWFLF